MAVFVRPVRAEDSVNFTEWAKRYFNPSKDFLTICAYKTDRILAYMPIEDSLFVSTQVLDSIVFNPEASQLEMAEAMRELIKHTVFLGYLKSSEYIYFIGDHPETNALAERVFEKIEFPVYRLSLRELENE